MNRKSIVFILFFVLLCQRVQADWVFNILYGIGMSALRVFPVLAIDSLVSSRNNPCSSLLAWRIQTGDLDAECPRAMRYIASELKRAGFTDSDVPVLDAASPAALGHHILFPVRDFEKVLASPTGKAPGVAEDVNSFKVVLAHELCHITNHAFWKGLFYDAVGSCAFGILDHFLPPANTAVGSVARYCAVETCSNLLVSWLKSIDEYRAEGAMSERFKDEPAVLKATSDFFMNENRKKGIINRLILYFYDEHSSYLSRAVRCAHVASQLVQCWQLVREIDEQVGKEAAHA